MPGCAAESLRYCHFQAAATRRRPWVLEPPSSQATANIINGMRPRTIGRALGIGVRVAGRIAGQKIASQAAQPSAPARATQAAAASSVPVRPGAPGEFAGQAARGVTHGIGGFLRPFRRVGGIVWLEVTGVLFLLPVVVFAPTLWRAGLSYPHTTDHKTFWSSALVVVVFLYLGATAFWRARRRSGRP
jgi:hypothetical protein